MVVTYRNNRIKIVAFGPFTQQRKRLRRKGFCGVANRDPKVFRIDHSPHSRRCFLNYAFPEASLVMINQRWKPSVTDATATKQRTVHCSP